jgi:sucrose phosphorylase
LLTPVVRDLMTLIRLRNSHPAFGGRFALEPGAEESLSLRWELGREFAQLRVWFEDLRYELQFSAQGSGRQLAFECAR